MTDKNFMRVEDVARELDVSKSYAYSTEAQQGA